MCHLLQPLNRQQSLVEEPTVYSPNADQVKSATRSILVIFLYSRGCALWMHPPRVRLSVQRSTLRSWGIRGRTIGTNDLNCQTVSMHLIMSRFTSQWKLKWIKWTIQCARIWTTQSRVTIHTCQTYTKTTCWSLMTRNPKQHNCITIAFNNNTRSNTSATNILLESSNTLNSEVELQKMLAWLIPFLRNIMTYNTGWDRFVMSN